MITLIFVTLIFLSNSKRKTQEHGHVRASAVRGGLKQRIFACGQLWIKQQEWGACMQKSAQTRKRTALPVLLFLLVLFLLLNLFGVDLQRFEAGIKVQR